MARNRMLNPEFWLDEEISALSPHARLLYMGLWGICDDNFATLPNRPSWIKAQVFPYESVNTLRLLNELENVGKIIKFIAEDSEWWYIKNFFKHQRVDRPSKPKYPKYDSTLVMLDDDSTSTRTEVKLSKDKRREEKCAAFEDFWKLYPNKKDKKNAQRSWERLLSEKQQFALEDLPLRVQSEAWKKDGGKYIPLPTTYLNGERWQDEIISNSSKIDKF